MWATVTATPTTLSFDPGDGSGQPVTCSGPGTKFKATVETWVSPGNPQGCSYRYTKTSTGVGGEVTSTYTITWTVTWKGSDGSGGTLNGLPEQHHLPVLSVAELQAVVTR